MLDKMIRKDDMPCAICGKSMRGYNINALYCSQECRNAARRGYDKARYDRERRGKRVCKYCGVPILEKRKQMCDICAEKRRYLTVRQMEEERKTFKPKKDDKKEAKTVKKKINPSGRFTLDELADMAAKRGTSYGKLVAFIDYNGRVPKKGERI